MGHDPILQQRTIDIIRKEIQEHQNAPKPKVVTYRVSPVSRLRRRYENWRYQWVWTLRHNEAYRRIRLAWRVLRTGHSVHHWSDYDD